jgi:hypothetical protein
MPYIGSPPDTQKGNTLTKKDRAIMSLFVYITDECREQAQKSGANIVDALERLKAHVEKEQNFLNFHEFPAPYFAKKKFPRFQYRLLAAKEEVRVDGESHIVLVFWAFLTKGDVEYERFYRDTVGYGERKYKPVRRKLDLEQYIRHRTVEAPPPVKPRLTDNDYRYLNDAIAKRNDGETMVCETKEWVDAVTAEENKGALAFIHQTVFGLVEQLDNTKNSSGGWERAPVGQTGYEIIHLHDSANNRLVLWDLVRRGEDSHAPATGATGLDSTFGRAYPSFFVFDEKLWMELEQDLNGNLALTEEEDEVLHSSRSEDAKFPLFIKGRAGSGKSTILQYLFAEYFARWARSRPCATPPGYFACNKDLVQRAREVVKSILSNKADYSGINAENDTFASSFHVLREFFISLLERQEQAKLFPLNRYIDYARFVRLWEKRFERVGSAREEYGPEISWHVIRTFIKGMATFDGLDEDATADDWVLDWEGFKDLNDRHKNVTQEQFKLVFEKVWEGWYKQLTAASPQGDGLWDDQDLVGFLLRQNRFDRRAEAKFPGVFCDEAQDFTQAEVMAFLKMSRYSDHSILPSELRTLPFAFAGDEFQTLNPSGFRWESVKDMYRTEFIQRICPLAASAGGAELLVHDLKNNYRSDASVVRFGNTVQLLRAAQFGHSTLDPQLDRKALDGNSRGRPVSFFDKDDPVFWNGVKQRRDIHLIVPCREGEEAQYIRDHLDKHVVIDEKGLSHPPVLSASRAKGLEYQCVAVYGFGDSLGDARLVDGGKPLVQREELTDEARLALEYFLNHLYVGVSRPRNQLYIADSEQGVKRLWTFAKDPQSLERLLGRMRNVTQWREHTTTWVQGDEQAMEASYDVDFSGLAKQSEKEGDIRQAPEEMRRAAQWWREAMNNEGAERCEAKALRIERRFPEAAEKFVSLAMIPEAIDCYWLMDGQPAGWQHIHEVLKHHPDIGHGMREKVASALGAKPVIPESCSRLLGEFLRDVEMRNNLAEHQTPEWKAAISELADHSLKERGAGAGENFATIAKLAELGLVNNARRYADRACERGLWNAARAVYEAAGETLEQSKNDNYLRCCAVSLPYPENLVFLGKMEEKLSDVIVDEYVSNREKGPLTEGQAAIVARAMLRTNRMKDLACVVSSFVNPKTFQSLSSLVSGKEEQRLLRSLKIIAKAQKIVENKLPELARNLVIQVQEAILLVQLASRMAWETAYDGPDPDLEPLLKNISMDWVNEGRTFLNLTWYEIGTALELHCPPDICHAFFDEFCYSFKVPREIIPHYITAIDRNVKFLKQQNKLAPDTEQEYNQKREELIQRWKISASEIPVNIAPLNDWDSLKAKYINRLAKIISPNRTPVSGEAAVDARTEEDEQDAPPLTDS